MTCKNGLNDFASALSVLKDDIDTQLFTDTFRLYNILSNYISSLTALDITGDLFDTHFLSSSSDCSPADIPTPLRESKRKEYNELFDLISNPHFLNLIYVYDVVVQKRFEPILPEIPNEVDEDEGTDIKLIRLNKNHEPLGATIKLDERTDHLIIARIMHGGVADRCGCFNVGDRLIELNGIDVHGKQPSEIVKTLNTCQGTIIFKIVPAITHSSSPSLNKIYSPSFDSTKMSVRALFDYDPTSDLMNPCPEAGLKFNCGDILEIVDSSDHLWWQATLLRSRGDANPRNQSTNNNVGLVPSKSFLQEQKIPIDRPTTSNGSYENEMLASKSQKLKKLQPENADVDKLYEEIVHLYPDSRYKRPVVLIGPSGVGRNELKRRLILLNPDRFATTVPYTSRKARPDETDGVEYNFVSRAIMEQWMNENRFLEYGEYKGNLYGTTLDNIKQISTDLNRICVLTPHSQAIKVVRNGDFKPFIVFVKPPSLEILKLTRQNSGIALFTDVELEKMLEDARKLEKRYKIYFDYTLVNDFLDPTFEKLLKLSIDIETKPQWVPKAWM